MTRHSLHSVDIAARGGVQQMFAPGWWRAPIKRPKQRDAVQRNFNFGDSSPGLVTPELAVRPRQVALLGTVCGAPADLTAQKNETPWLGGGGGFKAHVEAESGHPTDNGRVVQMGKRLSTVRAALALKGYELRDMAGCGWLVTRWNMARDARDLDAVEAFARQVGAA